MSAKPSIDSKREVIELALDSAQTQRLKQFSETHGIPLKSVLLAVHLKALSLRSPGRPVVTGVNVAANAESETLPLVFEAGGDDASWGDLARRVAAWEESVQRPSGRPPGATEDPGDRSPLFDTRFLFEPSLAGASAATGEVTLETRIHAFWQALLPGASFGPDDGFFDAGGNSLLLVHLHEKLEARWPGIFTVAQLFAVNTIAAQARCIRDKDADQPREAIRPMRAEASGDAANKAGKTTQRVAIIGLALRLAGAETLEACWRDVAAGADLVRPLPDTRRADVQAMLAQLGGSAAEHIHEAAWLDDVFTFDPERFRLSPADATLIDPEQRLFLETALMALENAGYGGKALDNEKIGVFVGSSGATIWRDLVDRVAPERAEQVFVLNVPSNVATRLPFLHNWRGPAGLIDTACSSTLAAVHLACQALANGECSAALVGGAKRMLLPAAAGEKFSIASSTDRTHAFDESADGTGAGEGAVVFLLKPLERAQADGDSIHAVILGTAINQDGASSGMAAPNPAAQAEVIVAAARKAEVPLASLSYIEAHGTGTHLGDPVEIEGISRAFAGETKDKGFAAIGSGKGNYGHLDFCAGALSLLRAVLCLQHDQAPPQPHFLRANPRIDFANSPVRVPDRLMPLANRGTPRRAGVSSFGLSGINVHAVIEAPPAVGPRPPTSPTGWTVVGVSAATKELLVRYVSSLVETLRARPGISLADIASTLNTGRDSLAERLAVCVCDREELLSTWDAFLAGTGAARRLLGTLARRQKTQNCAPVSCLATDERSALKAAQAYVEGARLTWPPQPPAHRIHLPPAPLQRIVCRPELRAAGSRQEVRPLLLGPPVDTPEGIRRELDVHSPVFWPVAEHRLGGIPTLVGMGLLPILTEAWTELSGGKFAPFSIRDLSWWRPLQSPSLKPGSVSLLIAATDAGAQQTNLGGRGLDGAWRIFAEAALAGLAEPPPASLNPPQLEQDVGGLMPAPAFNVEEGAFVSVSDRWDCLRSVGAKGDSILARLELPPGHPPGESWQGLHPGLLDCAASLVLVRPGLVPAGCAEVLVFSPLPEKVLAYAVRRPGSNGGIEAEVSLCDAESGAVCVAFRGLRFVAPAHRGNQEKETGKIPVLPSLPVWLPAPRASATSLPSALFIIGEGALFERIAAHNEVKVRLVATTGSFAPSLESLAVVADGRVGHLLLVPGPGEDLGSRVTQVLHHLLSVMRQPLQLLAVGQGAFVSEVKSSSYPVPPDAALIAGLVSVAAREKSTLSTRYLDVDEQTPVTAILGEFAAFDHPPGTPILLDRDGGRLRRDFVPLPVTPSTPAMVWPNSGCCVITGGTGGLALLLAEELSAGGAVALALISRHAVPAGNEADAQKRRERLTALAGRGIRVRHWCADVSDRAQLAQVLDEVRRELGPITAVVHNAGLADGRLLVNEDAASFARATAPKVAGARLLDLLTRHDPVQAFVLSGSLDAIAGRAGAGAYVAANAFLDAFTSWRRREGRPALVIDWCQIGEIGMAARLLEGKVSEYGLPPDEVVRLWRLALASGAPQVTLRYRDKPEEKAVVVPPRATPPKMLEAALTRIWAEILGYERVELEDDFYALGGDSISGLQIVDRIVRDLGHPAAITDLLESGTVQALANRLRGQASAAKASLPGNASTSLAPAPTLARYPLGWEQLTVVRAQLAVADNIAFNLPNGIALPPNCDLPRLESALGQLIARHEILRTRFDLTGQEPEMEILPAFLPAVPRLRPADGITPAFGRDWVRPFDLATAPPLRFALVEKPDGTPDALIFDIHHSLADGLSIELLTAELMALYAGQELPPPALQFKDYAWWSRRGAGVEAQEQARAFWLKRYAGPLPILDLPTDRPRPASHTGNCCTVDFVLPPEATEALRRFASARRTTPFTVVLATWAALLSRYTRSDDLVISVPVNARDVVDAPAMPGMMVALLPLRFSLRPNESVSRFIGRVREDLAEALRHRACPLGMLLEALAPPAAPERALLSEVRLSYMNYAEGLTSEGSSTEAFRLFGLERGNNTNDLSIFVRDLPKQISVVCEYYTAIFDRERIERMGRHFATLLAALVSSTEETALAQLPLLTAAERDWLDRIGDGSTTTLAEQTSLFALFAAKAGERGSAPAVCDDTESLSYAELLQHSCGIAHALVAAGVRPGDMVAMHLARSCTAVATVLGINAVGAAYVPLDPAYPPVRVAWILQDAPCRVVIADAPGRRVLAEADQWAEAGVAQPLPAKRVLLAAEELARSGGTPPAVQRPSEALAYLMYTSGSTGTPKGVPVFERGIVRLVVNEDYVGLRPDDRMLQAAPLAFDASTFEIWGALLNGSQLCIASREDVLDPAALAARLQQQRISVLWLTAGLFNRQVEAFPESLSHARAVLTGGETLSPAHLRRAMHACPETQFFNGYGPTENTTFTTVHLVDATDLEKNSIPIGRPIPHTSVRVQDDTGQLVPIGLWGEIVTGGRGVADGYWNRRDLTDASFVSAADGRRCYRTGDLGRWRADGVLEFGGRKDGQIKLRGFRIEPGEIEEALTLHPAIRGAAVLLRPETSELIACVLTGDQPPAAAELRAWLLHRLPAYMVPARFIQVVHLPVNPNGKLDRARLDAEAASGRPLPNDNAAAGGAPVSEMERLVAEVFSEVFAHPVTDRSASFLDLGGHSLIIIRAINRIVQRTGVRLTVSDFFAHPSVAELATRIEVGAKMASAGARIPRAADTAFPFASHAEERLYLVHGLDATASAYNMTFAFPAGHGFSPKALRRALSALIARHESLRTAFEEREGRITRRIVEAGLAPLAWVEDDLSRHSDSRTEARRLMQYEVAQPFDLATPPLLRVRLIRLSEDETLVLILTHHIVHDGWSSRVFLRELGPCYHAALQGREADLPPLPISVRDYAIWQRTRDWSGTAAWWRKTLENAPGRIALPNDRPLPEIPSNRGATLRKELPPEITRGLQALARERRVSMAALGLSLFAALLFRVTRQRDLVIGMGVAGRDHAELEGLIGFFVNVLPVRIQLNEESEFDDLLLQAHATLMATMERRDYPFDCLVRDLAPKRSGGRQPLVNVVFEYQRFGPLSSGPIFPPAPATSATFLRSVDDIIYTQTAKHDLLLFFVEQDERTELVLEYDTDTFDATTVERWLNALVQFAASVSRETHLRRSEPLRTQRVHL